MTILAGIVSRKSGVHVTDPACEALKRSISRNPADGRAEFRDAHAYLVKVDIGAFKSPARSLSPTGSIALLAGEPHLTCGGPFGPDREAHLAFLHEEWDQETFSSLRSASGTFCAAYYDPRTATTRLIADRLGLRPLYYAIVGDFVYFSSALRVLEALSEVPKQMDLSAVAEIVGFGYPFGGGTPYAGVRVLQPCEIVTIRGEGATSSHYFKWDSIPVSGASEADALNGAFEKFEAAMRRRLRGDKTTFAYLSGGLDSRCTVASLRSAGVHVSSFNFSLPDTQDQVFALEFARRIGTIHHEVPTEPDPDWSAVMADAWRASPQRAERAVERPNVTWTGEGGSVGLGHVYLTPEIVSRLRASDWAGAIDVFLRQQQKRILTRILRPEFAARFQGHLHSRLRDELDAIRHPDPIRTFYIFLNLNGPRRHLARHFDTIDQHRLEFELPFYDSEFLEYITGIPAEPCLYHRFYVKWLSFFDRSVLAVPWQAYPGHAPSAIPIPKSLPDQWTAPPSVSHQRAVQRDLLKRSAAMLSASNFPSPLLRRYPLRLLWWATKLKIADYGYALRAACTYQKYWHVAGGRYQLRGADLTGGVRACKV